jgi:hypothetical protein
VVNAPVVFASGHGVREAVGVEVGVAERRLDRRKLARSVNNVNELGRIIRYSVAACCKEGR